MSPKLGRTPSFNIGTGFTGICAIMGELLRLHNERGSFAGMPPLVCQRKGM